MAYKPEEVIFCPTGECNLHCRHCTVTRTQEKLSTKYALRFLRDCKDNGIERVGFSGGEPFLAPAFLIRVCAAAVEHDMFFDRLMTNAVWFRNDRELKSTLTELHEAGFDGTFGVSVDAFHKQDLRKVADFIRTAIRLWERDECVQIVSVSGASDQETAVKLQTLDGFLGKKLSRAVIALSSAATDSCLIDPWSADRWFEDDFCRGPGQVFYVFPDGRVSVCCGYANENEDLIIGSIRKDGVRRLLKNASERPFIRAVYEKGLGEVRKCLEDKGVKFPGITADHCCFCWYLLNKISRETLDSCLD